MRAQKLNPVGGIVEEIGQRRLTSNWSSDWIKSLWRSRRQTSNVDCFLKILRWALKLEFWSSSFYTPLGVINFDACWYFEDFWLFLSIWCDRWRKKSLELVPGMFWNVGYHNVSKTLPWCSGCLQEIVKAPENCRHLNIKCALLRWLEMFARDAAWSKLWEVQSNLRIIKVSTKTWNRKVVQKSSCLKVF